MDQLFIKFMVDLSSDKSVDPNYDMLVEKEVHQHGDTSGSSPNREVNMFVLKSFKAYVACKIWNKVVSMVKVKYYNWTYNINFNLIVYSCVMYF